MWWHCRWCISMSSLTVCSVERCPVKRWTAACWQGWLVKDKCGSRFSQTFGILKPLRDPLVRAQQSVYYTCPHRKRQTVTYPQEITKKFEAKYWITLHSPGGILVATSIQITNMGSCFKKKIIESPNPLYVLWHGVIKGVRQRNVITCKIIAVLPPLPALGRFNEAKMVKTKPNIF